MTPEALWSGACPQCGVGRIFFGPAEEWYRRKTINKQYDLELMDCNECGRNYPIFMERPINLTRIPME